MGKPTICIGENKDADQLRGYRSAISAFVFATRIVQFLFYLNPKFQASSSFLLLCRPVCVRPVGKPHCWFSHETAHLMFIFFLVQVYIFDTNRVIQTQALKDIKLRKLVKQNVCNVGFRPKIYENLLTVTKHFKIKI